MTKSERNAYAKAWRLKQSPEKQEAIRLKIRECNDKRREELNALRKVRYYEDPVSHGETVKRRRDEIKSDPNLFGEWLKKRRESKRRRIRGITEEQWQKLVEDSGFHCTYCNREFGPDNVPEPDHVVSVKLGGTRTLDNIVPSCRSCNARKQNKPVEQFLAELRGSLPK